MESCYFNKFWGFYHKLLFLVNNSKSKFIEHSWHSGKVLYWGSIGVCSILALDIFSESDSNVTQRIRSQSNDVVQLRTQVQKCPISVVNTRFCTGSKVCEHSFSTPVVKYSTKKILCNRDFSYWTYPDIRRYHPVIFHRKSIVILKIRVGFVSPEIWSERTATNGRGYVKGPRPRFLDTAACLPKKAFGAEFSNISPYSKFYKSE